MTIPPWASSKAMAETAIYSFMQRHKTRNSRGAAARRGSELTAERARRGGGIPHHPVTIRGRIPVSSIPRKTARTTKTTGVARAPQKGRVGAGQVFYDPRPSPWDNDGRAASQGE